MSDERTCPRCGQVKPDDKFCKDRNHCLDCQAYWMRWYRENKREVELARLRAKRRALSRLADLYNEEYDRIYEEERAKEGLPPVQRAHRRSRRPRSRS
jgi:hypothetical protein